jgi:hypothetical protein
VQVDDSIAPLEECVGRADLRAGRFVALIAEDWKEKTAGRREGALLDGLDPTAIHADWNVVLGFTGDRAGVATDAFSKIDGEPVVRHGRRL